jgi:hypothetical protein
MYAEDFAELLRSFVVAPSRRGLLAASLGGPLTALPLPLGLDETEAKNTSKRRRRRKHQARRKKRKNKQNPPSPDPIAHIDAACPRTAGLEESVEVNGNTRIAQTFTSFATGRLVRAEIPLFKSTGSSGDYILRISPVDTAGVPTNDVLAETVVANASVPDGESILSGVFGTPAAVVSGASYALVLTRPGDDEIELAGQFFNQCGGETYVSPDQTAPFALRSGDLGLDLAFTTFVLI